MNATTLRKLKTRLKELKAAREQRGLLETRCPDCGRWPWVMRILDRGEDDCPGCVALRDRYPHPLGPDGPRVVVVIGPAPHRDR